MFNAVEQRLRANPEADGPAGVVHEALSPGFGYTLGYRRKLLDKRSRFQHIEVFETEEFGNVLRLDGALQCSEKDEFLYHEALVHMAAFSHPHPVRALVIGGGDGGAAEELLKHPTIVEVVLVEIDKEVVGAASRYLHSVNGGLFDSPDARFRYVDGDGHAYLRQQEEPFDLIVLDLTDAGGPSLPLYGRDFYALCRQRLRSGGLMSLHLASPWAHERRLHRILAELEAARWEVRPFMTSILMSGGIWLMGLCVPEGGPLKGVLPVYRRELAGPALRYYSPEIHDAMRILPPYIRDMLHADP